MSRNEYTPWLMSSMAVPLAVTASGWTWPAALAAGAVCLILCWGVREKTKSSWIKAAQWAGCVLLMPEFLHKTYPCWDGKYAPYVVPTVILSLAVLSAIKGAAKAAAASNVLRYGVYFVLGAVLLSAVQKIELSQVHAAWEPKDPMLIVVLLLPTIGTAWNRPSGWFLYPTLVSAAAALVTYGVMGSIADLYQLSRSITLLGKAIRLDSIMACAITVGFFTFFSYLLTSVGEAWNGKRNNGIVLGAGTAFIIYLLGIRINGWLLAIMTIILWVILPLLESLKRNLRIK